MPCRHCYFAQRSNLMGRPRRGAPTQRTTYSYCFGYGSLNARNPATDAAGAGFRNVFLMDGASLEADTEAYEGIEGEGAHVVAISTRELD